MRAVALFIGLGALSFLITVFVPPLGVLLVAIPAVVLAGLWLRRDTLEDSEFERAARRALVISGVAVGWVAYASLALTR